MYCSRPDAHAAPPNDTPSAHYACCLPDAVACYAAVLPDTLLEQDSSLAQRSSLLTDTAVAGRRAQFVAGRRCAERAVAALGRFATIGRDGQGRPVWPAGLVGSITHTERFVAAVAARRSDLAAIGIDSEIVLNATVADEIATQILVDDEDKELTRLGLTRPEAMSLVFSAKEALFKCLNPIVDRFFDFHAARLVDADSARGMMRLRLRRDLDTRFPAGRQLDGRFCFSEGHVHCSVFAAANEAPAA